MKPFLYVFCSIPTLPPPPRTLPLPPCFLFEWGYPCERPSFLVLFSPLLGRLSTSDALLFNPPLIPFTLSFTSLRAPRRRKRCLCSNYSRPWSDWATPPPTTTPQETATQGFFFFQCILRFPCLQPRASESERERCQLTLASVCLPLLFLIQVHSPLPFPAFPTSRLVRVHSTFLRKQNKKKRAPDYDTSLKVCRWCQQACSRAHETFFCGNYQQLLILWNRYSSHCAGRAMQPLFMCSANLSARRCLLLWLSWRSSWNTVWLVGNKAF